MNGIGASACAWPEGLTESDTKAMHSQIPPSSSADEHCVQQSTTTEMNLTDITPHWIALHEDLGLGAPIADEAQYERLLALVDELFDSTAADPAHQLGGLVALLAERIGEYERRVHPWPNAATPAEVLAGKRRLNLRQVQALSARFAVPMEVFAG